MAAEREARSPDLLCLRLSYTLLVWGPDARIVRAVETCRRQDVEKMGAYPPPSSRLGRRR
jgi:hypothetical protein